MILDNTSLHTNCSETHTEGINVTLRNCSSSNITDCFGACSNSTSSVLYDVIDFDAFAYIFVVLSFYAVSMVLLMIKYIRREEEEVCLDYYYTEFVKREKFQNPIYKNKVALQNATTSGLIDKALQLLHGGAGAQLGLYQCVSEDKSEGRSQSPDQTSHLHSSVSCDLPVDIDSGPSSEVRVNSSEDDDDILCEPCPGDNLLETIV
ncbi:uncharacterized protein LOC110463311 isoform X2 [Mizuhopecten yessoensis]|uniref:uncharacterized protein LOC110463311 isoform X2 n=1 Tax=Mizuhopecten yessoensis TaxID=6573 RepID=UPI000B45CFC1|nr:uncharacterized protein LOC110463311 isoform X2 [Mizuhopecten yessoensis]